MLVSVSTRKTITNIKTMKHTSFVAEPLLRAFLWHFESMLKCTLYL